MLVASTPPVADDALGVPVSRNRHRALAVVTACVAGVLLLLYLAIASSSHDAPESPEPSSDDDTTKATIGAAAPHPKAALEAPKATTSDAPSARPSDAPSGSDMKAQPLDTHAARAAVPGPEASASGRAEVNEAASSRPRARARSSSAKRPAAKPTPETRAAKPAQRKAAEARKPRGAGFVADSPY